MNWIGVWENQNGSQLTIETVEDNQFVGTFDSKKGRAVQGQQYVVKGTINAELVAFHVNFGDIGSIVSFSGRLARDGALHTLWILTREYSDEDRIKKTEPWNCFTVNSDIFVKLDGLKSP